MYNIISLILGLSAWLFAVLAISSGQVSASHRNTFISFALCTTSLISQVIHIHRLVLIHDFSAIEDTIRAVVIASVALVSITLILNLIAVIKAKNK